MKYPNIYTLFRERVAHFRAGDGAGAHDVFFFRRDEHWHGISWARFAREAHEFAYALLAHGLTRGASVCILMGNMPEWPVADIGTISAGGVGVGLYPTSAAEQCHYIIEHSDAEFVLVDTRAQLDKLMSVRARLPKVKAVIVLDETAAGATEGVLSYREFLQRGRESRARARRRDGDHGLYFGHDWTTEGRVPEPSLHHQQRRVAARDDSDLRERHVVLLSTLLPRGRAHLRSLQPALRGCIGLLR